MLSTASRSPARSTSLATTSRGCRSRPLKAAAKGRGETALTPLRNKRVFVPDQKTKVALNLNQEMRTKYMTSTLPILTSSPSSISVIGGRHTRNKRAGSVRTCETCPTEVKRACSSVCSEMERYLDGNGGTISHNSPVAGQLKWDSVGDITEMAPADAASQDQSKTGSCVLMSRYAVDSVRMDRLTETSTP